MKELPTYENDWTPVDLPTAVREIQLLREEIRLLANVNRRLMKKQSNEYSEKAGK